MNNILVKNGECNKCGSLLHYDSDNIYHYESLMCWKCGSVYEVSGEVEKNGKEFEIPKSNQ